MKIALAQYDIVWEDKKRNMLLIKDYINKAGQEGAELICLPEMSLTGFSMNAEKTGEVEADSETIQFFLRAAEEYQIKIGFGMVTKSGSNSSDMLQTSSKKALNKYFIVNESGEILLNYEKIHPFTYSEESKFFDGGEKIVSCNLNGIEVSAFICYDLRFPEIFQIASRKADLILVPANWPETRILHYDTLLRARAIENQCYVAGINRVGSGDGLTYTGGSVIYDPYGVNVSEFVPVLSENDGLLMAEIHSDIVKDYRDTFPVKKDRKEDLYEKLRGMF